MKAERYRYILAGILIVAASIPIQEKRALSDPMTRQQLLTQMETYIQQVKNNAVQKEASTAAALPGWTAGNDPKWYGGNNLGLIKLFEDMLVNIFHDFPFGFLKCFNFKIGGLCWKRVGFIKIPWGFKISYRWPIGVVESKRDYQDRYAGEVAYDSFTQLGLREMLYYPDAQNIAAPEAVLHASLETSIRLNTGSYAPFIPWWGPIIPVSSVNASNVDLTPSGLPRRFRYDSGREGNLDRLEYAQYSSFAHFAWGLISTYFPALRMIPCGPPGQWQPAFASDFPSHIAMTRDPALGFTLYKDQDLMDDLQRWYQKPHACQEWMMNKNRNNIPFDMFDTASGLLSFLPAPLNPLADGDLSQYDGMCTNNWGGTIPFTTTHQLSDTAFITAGKGFEKALRLGYGMYKTFIEGTSAAYYTRYYRFNKDKDAYQLTYPHEWNCKNFGDPGKPFAGAQAPGKEGEYGLFAMTHWKKLPIEGKCCVDFATAAALMAAFAI